MKGRKNKVILTGKSFLQMQIPTSDSVSIVAVTPTTIGSGRLANLSKAFQFYRFTKLGIEMAPWTTNSNSQLSPGVLAYIPEEAPGLSVSSSMTAVAESPWVLPYGGQTLSSSTGTTQCETRCRKGFVPRAILNNAPVRSYVTNASTEDDFVVQGTLAAACETSISTGATNVPLYLSWECEFWGDIANALQ
jgi:hypothetical protein